MPSGFALKKAARILRHGGIVAYPTEAVYGFGCDPLDPEAVFRILDVKRRSVGAGLILIAADAAQLEPFFGPLTGAERARVEETWPDPATWLVPAGSATPFWITGGRARVAVRVTSHPVARALCRAAHMPLVSTSANRSRQPPARTALDVRLRFGAEVDYILGGDTGGHARPSQIRNVSTGEIVRR